MLVASLPSMDIGQSSGEESAPLRISKQWARTWLDWAAVGRRF